MYHLVKLKINDLKYIFLNLRLIMKIYYELIFHITTMSIRIAISMKMTTHKQH
jgi:hypothetical protein